MKRLILCLASLPILSLSAMADDQDDPGIPSAKDCPPSVSQTNYLDVSALGRKKHAAENMTEMHQDMAKKGFEFASMEIYDENGDLQGFFLTYTKDSAPDCD